MPKRPKDSYAVEPRKLPSGRWKGRVVRYDETGKRREMTQTFDTKREAKQWAEHEAALYRADPNRKPPSDDTLAQFCTQWVERLITVAETTRADYRLMCRYVSPALGQKPLKNVTAWDLQTLYTELAQRLAPRTIRYVHAVLHRALKDAVAWGLIPQNPADKARPPQDRPQPISPPLLEDVQAFLAVADHHRLKALWYVMALTGLRRGEALGLQWHDIDWDQRTLTISRTIVEKSGIGRAIHQPKTAAGRRTVAMSSFLYQILREHEVQQRLESQAFTGWQNDAGWVFTTRTGQILSPRNVYRDFQRLMARAGITRSVRIHDLRHAMASYWLANGVPVKVVSERLGHADIRITLQVYGHLLPHMQAEAAEQMDALIIKPAGEKDGPQMGRRNSSIPEDTP